jgi:hypothetical protein
VGLWLGRRQAVLQANEAREVGAEPVPAGGHRGVRGLAP